MSVKPKKARDISPKLSDACLRLATRVEDTCEVVCASFVYPDPQERRNHLSEFGNQLLFDALPFVTWLERTQHPGTADLEKRRLMLIQHEATECAASDLPQCEGGHLRTLPDDHPTTPAMMRFGALRATTILVGQALRGWASQIDGEHSRSKSSDACTQKKKAKARSNSDNKGPVVLAGLTKHHQYAEGGCVNLEPAGVNKLAAEIGVGAASVSRYLEKKFGSYKRYCTACTSGKIGHWLKLLNGEITPKELESSLGDRSNEVADD